MKLHRFGLATLLLAISAFSSADDVDILGAEFVQDGDGTWTVNVVLLHDDSGWDHYADKWRVVDPNGEVLGERVLLHPHEDEQPFARSESGITIPADQTTLNIEAHDLVHGLTPDRLTVDMTKVESGRLRVFAE